MLKTLTSYSYFLHKIDIYKNKPRRPSANFFDTLTIFSGNDEVTRFDGIGKDISKKISSDKIQKNFMMIR